MKKVIALMALAGLITVGCAHRDRNSGGTYDSTEMNSGTSSSENQDRSIDEKTNNSGNRSNSSDSNPNPSDKTPE